MFKNLNLKHSFQISNFKFQIHQQKEAWFLLLTSFTFFLLRLPSLFEPYWYGDEGIYEVIGYALTHGRLLYSGIWDNKPPMLYLIYALFSGSQGAAKFLSLLAGLGATWAIFFLSKKLFVKFLPAAMTTSIFAFLFAIPLIEGNIANAENFMLLPGILAGLLIYKVAQQSKKTYDLRLTTYLLVAGLLVGLSFLTKVVGVFDLSAFAVFLFLVSLPSFAFQDILSAIKKVLPLIIGFVIPVALCCLFFIATHTFSTFIHATLLSNVSYVNYGNQVSSPTGRQVIPQGFLILKTLLVGIVVLFFLLRRKHFAKETLFLFLWIVFSIYSSLFSARPYTHYSLVMLPSFSLLVGFLFANKKLRIVTLLAIAAMLIFVSKSFTFYSHPFSYYENFIAYVSGGKNTDEYQAFFDKVTPRDYAIAEYINSQRQEDQTIFVWGNSGQIYKLTHTLPPGRFIVAYHATMSPQNLSETRQALVQHPPTFVIILPGQDSIPYSLQSYRELLIIQGATIYGHI